MENIINYFAEVFIPKIIETRLNFYQDTNHCLGNLAIATKNATDELGCRILEELVEEMDQLIKKLPERKQKWVVERSSDKKMLTTTLGDITFTKTLYTSKTEHDKEGKLVECYLLDRFLELEPNQSMTEDVVAAVYEEAVETSYRKAGEECAPGGITKQTVKNLLHRTHFPRNYQIPEVKKQVEYLYIDADEDHIHLQFQEHRGDITRNAQGRKMNGAMTKMIYVYEGIEPEAPKSKRNHLIGTHYFLRGCSQNSKQMWKEVFSYINDTYDMANIKRIYVNADGGQWIKTGYREITDITYVLDEFHLAKYISKMIAHMKDSRDDARHEIYDCIRKHTKKEFFQLIERLNGCTNSEKIQKEVTDAANYILSNWTAAKLRLRKADGIIGSSTEGHVYHLLSSRMSTQAMGWSKHGADQMARLIEYSKNGGEMIELAKYQKQYIPMAAGAEAVILSAKEVLVSEHANRTKEQQAYGKYMESMRGTISLQSSKRLTFYLHGKL